MPSVKGEKYAAPPSRDRTRFRDPLPNRTQEEHTGPVVSEELDNGLLATRSGTDRDHPLVIEQLERYAHAAFDRGDPTSPTVLRTIKFGNPRLDATVTIEPMPT